MQGSSSTSIDSFLEWLEQEGKSLNTISTYHQELKKFEHWLQGNHQKLGDVTQGDVQDYILFLEEKGKSPITTDKILGAIRTFSKYLKKPHVTLGIQIQKADKNDEIDVLTKKECEMLLSEVREHENERNIAIVYMLLHTGIRVSELCGLDQSNVDFHEGNLKVMSPHGEERVIPLSHELKDHLMKYLPLDLMEKALFVSKSNERLTERSVQYMLKKYGVNAQKLRHTFCQQLIDKGVGLEVVSKLAGHKDINVTKKYARSRVQQSEYEDAIRKTFSTEG
ncbi:MULTISPECIES: tyrosine-type recombinase/integrase [Rossellomorea]|uniref:Tyrosine-type recombinase/integrase n=1 Tax=Rossellomorea vietnamensis TaxID=218284 RepID=A0A6I6UPE7_9BACI|nr:MULTISPECIES: tyrosine-type recombinase/integrase [Rossellomorea]QHE63257.1 tyrosine-type recombinase/integrase [Rossellomorea vietnamensis]WGG45294.1 tyrosine-type recombinase/integrase [Rossellomorea sp. DA94]